MKEPIPATGDQASISSAYELAKMFPDAVKKAAIVFAEFPATRETRDKAAAAYPQAGWKFLNCDQIYAIGGESDWKPFASNLKKCGVEAVVWVGSPDPEHGEPPERLEAGRLPTAGVGDRPERLHRELREVERAERRRRQQRLRTHDRCAVRVRRPGSRGQAVPRPDREERRHHGPARRCSRRPPSCCGRPA